MYKEFTVTELINPGENVLFLMCMFWYMDQIATAQRESQHHRSELKHLLNNRAPPLNQTEPDHAH